MILHVLGELILASVCLWAALRAMMQSEGWRVCGFVLMALGALTGALEYAGVSQAQPWHQWAVQCSSHWSLLLIAVGALSGRRGNALVMAIAALLWTVPDALVLAANLLALLVIGWRGRSQRWPLALIGCALFVVSGLWVAGPGGWLGTPRVDLYHLGLAIAVVCWTRAGLHGRWPTPRRTLYPTV